MVLPRKPERSQPIPNEPFESPEVTTIRGPYWSMPLGSGLEPDPYGSVQTAGSEPSAPTAYLYGPNGFVGVGTGLQIGAEGELEQSGSSYIYCTPQYGDLPVTYPPYSCETEVNTAGVTDFTDAWFNCQELTEFPCVDSSSVTDFSYAWEYCYGLTSFPTINTSTGENFTYSWAYSGLTTFPPLNVGSGVNFNGSWHGCYYLTEFPQLDVSKGVNFDSAWEYCSSLETFPNLDTSSGELFNDAWADCLSLQEMPTLDLSGGTTFVATWLRNTSLVTFPPGMFDHCSATFFPLAWRSCALSQESVDNILTSLDTAGQSNGIVNIDGGTSAAPSSAGLSAKASLQGKGWTVLTN